MFDISVITAVKLEDDGSKLLTSVPECITHLKQAVESVTMQDGLKVEQVIVSNGSDYPLSIVRDFIHTDPSRTQWLSLERGNVSEARNFGVKASRGNWIIVLDGDDQFARSDVLVNLWKWKCETSYVYGHMVRFDDTGLLDGGKSVSSGYDVRALREMTGTVGVTALHHRDAWGKIGGWSEWLNGLEDIEYWIKAAEVGICGLWVDTPMLRYRQRKGSRTQTIYQSREVIELRDRIRAKHRSFMGGYNMACASCPPAVQGGNQTFNAAEGYVQVKYVGPRIGSFNITTPNRRKYRVEGKGTWLNVAPEDMAWLMAHNTEGSLQYVPLQQPQAMPVQEPEAYTAVPFEPVPILTSVKEMGVRDAKLAINAETRIATLSIWLAQEKSSETPRKTILTELERRIAEVGY